MPEFVAEQYSSRFDAAAAVCAASAARQAAAQLTQEGVAVRLISSIFIPEDETCMYLYEADSVETVRTAARRAELSFDRIAQAVSETGGGSPDRVEIDIESTGGRP